MSGLRHIMMTGGFDPLSLSPNYYVNFQSADFVSTVDNNGTRARGNIIDSMTAQTGQAIANAGTLASKGVFNGVGAMMNLAAQFTTGSVSSFNFIHDGTDFDLFVNYFQTYAIAGNLRTILTNNGFSNTAKGILLYYDNTGGLNTLKLSIGNGVSNIFTVNVNGAITQHAYNKIRIKKVGNTVTVYVNGAQVGTHTRVNGYGVGDAAGTMTFASTTAATSYIYLVDFFVKNSVLSDANVTKMNNRFFESLTVSNMNVDVIWGDSNAVGQAPNTGLAAELVGVHNVLVMRQATGAVGETDYVEKLQSGRNQVRDNQTTTLHGIEMRYGYSWRSSDTSYNRAILKYSEGSTDAAAWVTPQLSYNRFMGAISWFIHDMYHIHRKSVTLRSIIHVHGANDVQLGDGANYKAAITDLVKAIIDRFNLATAQLGTIVKCRCVIFRAKTGTSGYDATAWGLVNTAQTDMGNGSILTDYPALAGYLVGAVSYSTEGLGTVDGTHYNESAYETMATQAYDYLQPYASE